MSSQAWPKAGNAIEYEYETCYIRETREKYLVTRYHEVSQGSKPGRIVGIRTEPDQNNCRSKVN